ADAGTPQEDRSAETAHRDVRWVVRRAARWAVNASCTGPGVAADVKRHHAPAGIVGAGRIVFNIRGNDYRLVVAVDFEKATIWIKPPSG
ncbi:MAG: type II toxin-antitoxin system HigB family toxin, partial [Reyranella sp.]|nr:type II toxin-antitoxin system HigB family toxin [Reyranella sp.]